MQLLITPLAAVDLEEIGGYIAKDLSQPCGLSAATRGTGSLKNAKQVLHGSLTKCGHGLMIRLAKKLPSNSLGWLWQRSTLSVWTIKPLMALAFRSLKATTRGAATTQPF